MDQALPVGRKINLRVGVHTLLVFILTFIDCETTLLQYVHLFVLFQGTVAICLLTLSRLLVKIFGKII